MRAPSRSATASSKRPWSARDTEFLRNSHSGFVAYVPPGALKKGEALVMTGTTAMAEPR